LGIRFLSIREMEDAWTNGPILEQIQIRRDTWPDSPLSGVELDQLTLFGLNPIDGEEVYLVWKPTKMYPLSSEPEVVEFITNGIDHFENLGDFILYHCQ